MPVCCVGVSADPPSAAMKARHVCLVNRFLTVGIFRPKLPFFSVRPDAPGSPSKLYVTLLLCSFFVSFGILSTSPPSFFFLPPRTRSKKQSLVHICSSPLPPHCRNSEVFIYIAVTNWKKNLKRTVSTKGNAKSKSISAPVRTMAYFAFLP